MVTRINRPATRRHVHIYNEDWDALVEFVGRNTANPLGPARAIREIVHAKVKSWRGAQTRAIEERVTEQEAQRDLEIMKRIVAS